MIGLLRWCIPAQRWVGIFSTDLFKDTLLHNSGINHTAKVLIASWFRQLLIDQSLFANCPHWGNLYIYIYVRLMGVMGCFVLENCGHTKTVYSKTEIIMRNGRTRQYCLHVNTVITLAWSCRRRMKWTPWFAGREPLGLLRRTSFATLSPCPQLLSQSLLCRAFRRREKPFGRKHHRRRRCFVKRFQLTHTHTVSHGNCQRCRGKSTGLKAAVACTDII